MGRRRVTDAWAALRLPPWVFLFSAWPWRALAYLLTSALLGLILVPLLATTIFLAPFWGILLGALERRRVRLLGGPPIASPHVPLGRHQRGAWIGVRLGEPVTWRETAYLIVATALGLLSLALTLFGAITILAPVVVMVEASRRTLTLNLWGDVWVVAGPADALPLVIAVLLAVVVLVYITVLVGAGQASIARALLSPRQEELESQVARLTLSRLSLVEAFESERRRIERDLHDGAQQQIVALSMTLGIVELELDEAAGRGADVQSARRLVATAHAQAETALASLRDTVRGIYPQVLLHHGLDAAITELTGRLTLPVTVLIDLPRRLPEPVEATVYFSVSEALTNIVRHSGARRAEVQAGLSERGVWLEVTDDGVGGAALSSGSGLRGLSERAEVFGGRLSLTSPSGGPTTLRIDLPLADSRGGGALAVTGF